MPDRKRGSRLRSPLSREIFMPQRDNYNKRDTRIEYQLYSQEYFSGADMHIYIGDVWVDEITNLEFSLQEETLPIFGYNSYTYDALVHGRRQVNGAFSINFKSVGYLTEVLKNAGAIGHFVENKVKEDIRHYDKYRLDEILQIYGMKSFEDIAEEYEKALWDKDHESDHIKSPTEAYFRKQDGQSYDIRIHYGPVEEAQKKGKYDKTSMRLQPNITVDVINDVHIYGVQKSASTMNQGAPVQEIYSFIARDLNGASNID